MIQSTTIAFLKNLKTNNDRDWFEANRPTYETARRDYLAFTQAMIEGISGFDTTVADAHLDPKKCIPRINRDVRFTKDKSPYKTNFFTIISRGGRKGNQAGYYFQLQPGESFAGGGAYMPVPPDLNRFRQEIDYNFKEWQAIVEGPPFVKVFPKGIESYDRLKRQPKGFKETNPAIEYLKMKGFYAVNALSDKALQTPKTNDLVLEHFRAIKPLIDFLNRTL